MTVDGEVTEQPKSGLKRQLRKSSKRADAPHAGKLGIPLRPQVNLMPPEVLEGRHIAVLKRRLVWVIILVTLASLVAFGLSYLVHTTAQSRYDASLTEADNLTAQKRQYSPVVQVQKDITNTTNARTFALSTEVNWSNYAYSIQAVLPEGVTIDSMSVAGISPGEDLAEGADPLTQAGIAVISFSATSDTLPDASEWIEALQSVPGLATANLQSSVLQDLSGDTTYLVSATVQVTEDALANRTFADPAAPTDDSEDGN